MSQVFKLIVQNSETCLNILKYIDKNIHHVNSLGVKISIDKIDKNGIDEDMIDILQQKGISRLPTLIAPDGKIFTGFKNIIELFEKNLNKAKNHDRVSGSEYEYSNKDVGTCPDLNDFWTRELYEDADEHGNLKARKDSEETEDSNVKNDISRKMASYEKKIPKHRLASSGRTGRDESQVGRRHSIDDEDDNIGHEEDIAITKNIETKRPRGSGEEAMDQRMLAAWMENN